MDGGTMPKTINTNFPFPRKQKYIGTGVHGFVLQFKMFWTMDLVRPSKLESLFCFIA